MIRFWLAISILTSAVVFSAAEVSAQASTGSDAFQASCTQCHDAQRATEKNKSLAGWISTIRRMAALDDANIAESDVIPIAEYLTALSQPKNAQRRGSTDSQAPNQDGPDADGPTPTSQAATSIDDSALATDAMSLSATASAIWIGGNDEHENPGFFPDVWIRADWQPKGVLRGRATACTSCHADQSGGSGFTMELVEAFLAYDLLAKYGNCNRSANAPKLDAELKAGRFVVPFGAFASQSHPGIYRTVTNPLMYNMGRQVRPVGNRPPVLPMPYSDEGIDLSTKFQWGQFGTTLNAYAVNGLQGIGPGVNFTTSRSYTDNNNSLAFGGRGTVRFGKLRIGGSLMNGRMEDEGRSELDYKFAGADATARLLDNDIRLYFEYAIRENDSDFGSRQLVYGTVSEVEALLLEKPSLSALLRYDTLEHRDQGGNEAIRRFTWGLSTGIGGSTNLIFNHEHWRFSDASSEIDFFGVRWVGTF